jgi:hypothetical protein
MGTEVAARFTGGRVSVTSIIGSGDDVRVPFAEGHELLEPELLESAFVEMDPVVDGFVGVLVELMRVGESYVLQETAAGSGNRLLEISLADEQLARIIFDEELYR